jgi:hypothetical protein
VVETLPWYHSAILIGLPEVPPRRTRNQHASLAAAGLRRVRRGGSDSSVTSSDDSALHARRERHANYECGLPLHEWVYSN